MDRNNDGQTILENDGLVKYYHPFIKPAESQKLFATLSDEITWKNDVVVMFGKKLEMRRKTAWYGDKPFHYTYSKISRKALSWTPALLQIKKGIEQLSGEKYNSCLLNYYNDGDDAMGWHSDDEPELDANKSIASVSVGASRKFTFKHKQTKESHNVMLDDGSALIMFPPTQNYWLHTLRKSKKITEPRINLTFRTITTNI